MKMTTNSMHQGSMLLPRTGHAPGERRWGEAPRRQPIAPMIAIAILLVLVAAPSAMSSSGRSGNPLKLMEEIAMGTWKQTGLIQESNDHLKQIDQNSSGLVELNTDMIGIAKATKGMEEKTVLLNNQLAGVGSSVGTSRDQLAAVDAKLGTTAAGMGSIRTNVSGSLTGTNAIVGEFSTIDSAITTMNKDLGTSIKLMGKSGPLTKAFANNQTLLPITGGDPKPYGVPSLAAGNRVMTVVLTMIDAMQNGKLLPARKDRHVASNPLVGLPIQLKVPDGTAVAVQVRPFDGTYGLPGQDYFINTQVGGF